MNQKIRLYSGLILFSFVLCHYLNHSVGLVSVITMEQLRPYFLAPWRSFLGTAILLTATILHILMSLHVIFQRRSLSLKRWELIQLIFGLSIPFLLANHLIATRFSELLNGTEIYYIHALVVYWIGSPTLGILQAISLVVVWVHGCIGIHFWLRTKAFYSNCRWILSQLAIVIPTLAFAGYISAGFQTRELATDPNFIPDLLEKGNITNQTNDWVYEWTVYAFFGIAFLTLLPFAFRFIRKALSKLQKRAQLQFSDGRIFSIPPGATILETLRDNKVSVASVCGGRGRCTTCRVRIIKGHDDLPLPESTEAAALARIEALPSVRLACQLRPTTDVSLIPLMPANATASDGRRPGGLDGMEMKVAIMFVDLRGSTKLGEDKLPYDVLFILNQFFSEMTSSLKVSKGHYAQFNGDGLMAIYGLNGGNSKDHAQQAIHGAKEMFRRLGILNQQLASELKQPLQIGIGVHFGEAIVGAMGPPDNQLLTAIGDNVNIAARLESLCREYDAPFIISESAAQAAGLTLSEGNAHNVAVKGRNKEVKFFALKEPPNL